MKSLTIVSLMLSAFAMASSTAYAVGTRDYCTQTNRILADRTIALEDDLTSYRGSFCETDPRVRLIFDASKAPDGFGITAQFVDGTIGTGGAIQITLPDHTRVANCAPILVRIERNVFEQDAVLFVSGDLPTSSLISISNNRFDVGVRHDLMLSISDNFIAPIAFGDREIEQLMYTNAQITIFDNIINVEDRSGEKDPFETYGVFMASHIYMNGESGLMIQRNTITAKAKQKSVGVYCPRYTFMMGNNTLAQIASNTIEVSNGIMVHTPSVTADGSQTFTCDFSRNKGRILAVHSSTYAFIIGGANLTARSTFDVADNEIVHIAEPTMSVSTRLFFNGPAHVREKAMLHIWYNTMNTKGGSPQIAFGGPVTVEQEGQLMVVGNQAERQEALILGLPPLNIHSLYLKNTGSFLIAQNTFGSANTNNKPRMIALSTLGGQVQVDDTASFMLCRNKFFGALFASDAEVADAVDANLKPVIRAQAQCGEEITTVPTTTASTTPPVSTRDYGTTVAPSANDANRRIAVCMSVSTIASAIVALFWL